MKKRRPWLQRSIRILLICSISILISQLFLRGLWRILAFDPTFSAIFAQIRGACILPPILPALFLSTVAVLGHPWLRRRSLLLALFADTVLTLLLMVICILFSRVNGVVFYDVVSSLLPLLESGVL